MHKFLLYPCILILGFAAFGQPSPINRRAFALASLANTPITPQSIPGLAYWWVSSDLNPTNVVNSWTDRIQGAIWTNSGTSSLHPTNTPNGMWFDGSKNQFLTNLPALGNSLDFRGSEIWGITACTKTNFSPILSRSLAANAWVFYDGSCNLSMSIPSGANGQVGAFATNIFTDWLRMSSNNTVTYACYGWTNGVNHSSLGNDSTSINITYMGRDQNSTASYFVIKELAIYTNVNLTSSQVQTILHFYATNTYGYTP